MKVNILEPHNYTGPERRKNLTLASEESLSVCRWRFWDLVIQKIVRNMISIKFILFNELLATSICGLFLSAIDSMSFSIISATCLVTIVLGEVYTDTKLVYRDGDRT